MIMLTVSLFFPFGDCILLRGMLKSCLLPAHHIIRAGKCGTVEEKSTPRLNHCAPSTFSCFHESLFCPFFFHSMCSQESSFHLLFSSFDGLAVTIFIEERLKVFSSQWHTSIAHIPLFGIFDEVF